ncbi:membrane protein [Allostella vacuolata]|nr:membrane protein [Stella vacuolata]
MRDPVIFEIMATPPEVIAVRLGAALLLGGCIGLDREWRQKSAGLRTHMLIALAAATFTILAAELHLDAAATQPDGSTDPIRIIEAVTAGVAFLGAGAIVRGRGSVRGMTTGAGIWLAGALGLACGAGYAALAGIAVVLAILVLTVLGRLEHVARKAVNGAEEKAPAASS